MRVLILFLLSVALANGWSINHESKADEHMSKDWWDYGVFYQVNQLTVQRKIKFIEKKILRFTQDRLKTVMVTAEVISRESQKNWIIWTILE